MNHDVPRPLRRQALTLVEVCLVISLLIVIGSFAIPLLGGAVERRALTSGADLLRAAWSRARLAAMQSGEPYAVRLEPKGSRFQVLALDQLALPESQVLEPDDPNAERMPSDILRLARNRLPEGVIFARADIADSNQITATFGSAGEGPWSRPMLFRPDGTCSDASVLLANEPSQTVRVTLRGLTGTSNSGDVDREPIQ
jgi:type II secretory pathway pseudopilin PulG